MTYVAERHLERDVTGAPIRHPMLDNIFTGFESGRYVRSGILHSYLGYKSPNQYEAEMVEMKKAA